MLRYAPPLKLTQGPYTILWPAEKRRKDDDPRVYPPVEGLPANMRQSCGGQVYMFVEKPPDTIYTRERLWNEIRPQITKVLNSICPNWHNALNEKHYLSVSVRLYFGGFYLDRNYVPSSGPVPNSGTFVNFADLTFTWAQDGYVPPVGAYLRNTSLRLFAPTIFGFQGRSNKGELHATMAGLNRGGLKPPPGILTPEENLALLDEDYRDFPHFNLLQVLSHDEQLKSFWERRIKMEIFMSDPESYVPMLLGGFANLLHEDRCQREREEQLIPSPDCDQ